MNTFLTTRKVLDCISFILTTAEVSVVCWWKYIVSKQISDGL